MNQPTLDGIAPGITGQKIIKDTEEWIQRNPFAYSEMVRHAKERLRAGRRTSISELAEEARYNMRLNGDTDGFKVNNNIRAGLARKMIAECPELAKVIEVRSSKADWA